jgi:N-acetyl-alpha-D-muramate 1-phosphate uridylyltransferase
MILAAGRGLRMRPLTDSIPKALLEAGGKPLIVWQIERLKRAGIHEIVINVAHLGEKIMRSLSDGRRFGVAIRYSIEQQALESAGGVAYALPLFGAAPFIVVNADVYCDFDYQRLIATELAPATLAHLVLVDNPEHHPQGDFVLRDGVIASDRGDKLTFSGIGLYRAELFAAVPRGAKAKLGPLIGEAAAQGRVSAEQHRGLWFDVGTQERLACVDAILRKASGSTADD